MLILFFSVYWLAPMDDVTAALCMAELSWELAGIIVLGMMHARA